MGCVSFGTINPVHMRSIKYPVAIAALVLAGLGAIILVAIAGWMLRRRDFYRPWMMLGALSMTFGLASLPLWPRA